MALLQEFKEFINKGNVIDLAVGVIIGAAFGKITTSLVEDVITPPLGKLIGGVNFADLFIALDGKTYPSVAVAKQAGAATINYGNFLNVVLQFFIVAFAVFLLVKFVNRLRRTKEDIAVAQEPPAQEKLLAEIRDLLKKQAEA